MTNLFILMLLYLAYTAASFWLFNFNFLSPSFVFSLSMSLMLSLAYYTAVNLGMLFAINLQTFSIFAFAGFVFIATEFFVYASHAVKHLQNEECTRTLPAEPQPLIISWQFQFAFTCLLALSVVLAVIVLYMNTGGGSWSQRMGAYKEMFLHNPDKIRWRFIVAQLFKINFAGMNLFGYVLIYNLTVCSVRVRKLMFYVIDTVLYALFVSVYTGGRQAAIETVLFFMMLYIALNMKPGGRQKIYRLIRRMIPLLVVLACLFTAAGSLVGRVQTQKSALQNIAEYICGGLYSFNLHIDEAASTKLFGQATFAYVYAIPQNMGIIPRDDTVMITGEFDIYGNTVTIFGRWYKDFGTAGVFVMTCLVSLFYSLMFYGKIIHSRNVTREHHTARIFYCQFMMALVWAGYDDRVAALMTTQTVTFLILVAVLYRMLIVDGLKIF